MSVIIECKDLSQKYGKNVALDNISLSIESGRIVGLLGPNGCGKTTLIKMLTGMLRDEAKAIKIGGCEIGEQSKKIVSYAPDRVCFPKERTVQNIIDFYELVYDDFDKDEAARNMEKVGVNTDESIGKMSKGTAEKLQLIMTMSRKAGLYVLDEPFGGVDPAARESILKLMLSMMPEESTLLISTHQISDVENILDDAIFMKEGKVLFHKSVEEIREEYGKSLNEVFKEEFR